MLWYLTANPAQPHSYLLQLVWVHSPFALEPVEVVAHAMFCVHLQEIGYFDPPWEEG